MTTTRYWVGNTGNWSDTSHWSLTSGGSGGESVPDGVAIFDANSFDSDSYEVSISSTVRIQIDISLDCYKFTFTVISGGIFSLRNNLSIYGLEIYVDGQLITNNHNITIMEGGQVVFSDQSVITLGSSTLTLGETSTFFISGSSPGITLTGGNIIWPGTGNIVVASWCILKDNTATGGAEFDAKYLDNCTDNGGNVGWNFAFPLLPFVVSQIGGIVSVQNCTIKNSTATGGATFESYTSNGNIYGGQVSGWIFEQETPYLISIGIAALSPSMLVGTSQQIMAIGYYSDGSQRIITQLVSWTSSNTIVATIDSTGLLVALQLGITFITAFINTDLGLIESRAMLQVGQITLSMFQNQNINLQQVYITSDPNQSFRCVLTVDGNNITLGFQIRWNSIANYWMMTLIDINTGNYIVDAIPLTTGVLPTPNLLQPYGYLGIGSCFIIDVSGIGNDYPNSSNLGTDYIMLWGDTEK